LQRFEEHKLLFSCNAYSIPQVILPELVKFSRSQLHQLVLRCSLQVSPVQVQLIAKYLERYPSVKVATKPLHLLIIIFKGDITSALQSLNVLLVTSVFCHCLDKLNPCLLVLFEYF